MDVRLTSFQYSYYWSSENNFYSLYRHGMVVVDVCVCVGGGGGESFCVYRKVQRKRANMKTHLAVACSQAWQRGPSVTWTLTAVTPCTALELRAARPAPVTPAMSSLPSALAVSHRDVKV